jgi:transposase InsO family protein
MNKSTPSEFEIRLLRPFHKLKQQRIFANMVVVQAPVPRPKTIVHLELLHNRLGHPSMKSLIAAQAAELYNDVSIEFEPTGHCIGCKIGAIRTANRGNHPVGPTATPGSIWFLDIIDNPSRTGLTTASYFPYYLNAIDSASRYQILFGLRNKNTTIIIEKLLSLQTVHRCRDNFTLLGDLTDFHVDAGSQFLSQEFRQWCHSFNINVIAAAPRHQEQNGTAESAWSHIRAIVFKILARARLDHPFFDCAIQYAWQIKNVLPLRRLTITNIDNTTRPSTPFEKYFLTKPNISRFHVFGCPCEVKVGSRRQQQGVAVSSLLTTTNIIQRGIRGIFVGFPIDQAGYLIYTPQSGRFLVSLDVAFDESFTSALAFPNLLYHDALPTRQAHTGRSTGGYIAHTGPPNVYHDTATPDIPWVPYTAIGTDNVPDDISIDIDSVVDSFPIVDDPIEHNPIIDDPVEHLPFDLFDDTDSENEDVIVASISPASLPAVTVDSTPQKVLLKSPPMPAPPRKSS